jgi:16S rRNA (cytosine1402-N4)-methyltransferase
MMAGRGAHMAAVGGPARHIPVMLSEVLRALEPRSGAIIVDGTFGAGGYSKAILEAADCKVIAIDRDPEAITAGKALAEKFPSRLKLVAGRFGDMEEIMKREGIEAVNGVALDLGVSSLQLDEASRGFSFMKEGPLDMRMGKEGPSASDIVNELSAGELAEIIGKLGEEGRSRAIAKAIVARRAEMPIETTKELSDIVARVLGRKRDEAKHPATRTFQALRLYLNDELDELAHGLSAAEQLLKAGGRLVVVTFHSLEDRITKRFFASRSTPAPRASRHLPEASAADFAPSFRLLNRRPIEPNQSEIRRNPRARSARLRAAERTAAPAHALDLAALGVPQISFGM